MNKGLFFALTALLLCGSQFCFAQTHDSHIDSLSAAIVTSDYIQRKGTEYVVYVRHNPEAQDKSLMEFMNTLPGVNGLSINGQETSLVYVNGREMKMDPTELTKYLKGLNAQDVKTIRILPFAGAAYRADHKGGVIHIQLKYGDNSKGSGNLSTPLSLYLYNAGIVADPTLSYNYVNKNFSSYSYVDMHYTQKGKEVQDKVTELNGNKEWQNISRALTYYTLDQSLGYSINDKHSFGFALAGTYKPFEENFIKTMDESSSSHFIKSKDDVLLYQSSLTYNLSYGAMGSEFRIGTDYCGLKQNQEQENDYAGIIVKQKDKTRDNLWSVTADLVHVIGEGKAFLNAGLFYRNMNADLGYNYGMTDMSFIHTEKNYGAYADYLRGFLDGAISINLGLRLESLNMDQTFSDDQLNNHNYNFCELFPSASISYNPSGKTSTSLNYSRNVDWPNMMLFSPIVYQDGRNQFHSGTNNAEPSFGNSITFSETFNNKHVISLSAKWQNSMFDSYYEIRENDLYKSYSNIGNYWGLKLYLNSSEYLFDKKMKYSINANAKYSHFYHEQYGITDSFSFSISPNLTFLFANKWRFAITGNYSSPHKTATYILGENWTVGCNAWKTFNKHLYINISLINLLRKKNIKMESTVPGMNYSYLSTPRFQRIEVNIVYKFGNQKINANQTIKDYELMSRAVSSNN